MPDDVTAFKREIAGLYDRAAPSYGQVGTPLFQHAGRRLVELGGAIAGARVLDVAAGQGAVLFAAAERVGPTGYVLGVDLSEGMVRETAAEIARRGITNAEMRLMDAERLDLPDASFDVVLCSFAIFFFAHVEHVIEGFRRLLRSEGTLGIALAEQNDPRWKWQNDLFAKYASLKPPPTAVSGRELRRPEVLVTLLQTAGFADVREVTEEVSFAFQSPDEWWESLWTHGTRRALEAMTEEGRARFKAEAFAHLEEMALSGGLLERYRFILVFGRKLG